MSLVNLNDLRDILTQLKDKYDVILFGSAIEGGMRPDSDVDIAVLSHTQNKNRNVKLMKDLIGIFPPKFDIRVFELFPIYIQISIIENYQIIFGDSLEISEYFYSFRKKWDDCKHRILLNQFASYRERLSLMK